MRNRTKEKAMSEQDRVSWEVALKALWRYPWAIALWRSGRDARLLTGIALTALAMAALMIKSMLGGSARAPVAMSMAADALMGALGVGLLEPPKEAIGWIAMGAGLAIKAMVICHVGLKMSREAEPGGSRQWMAAIGETVEAAVMGATSAIKKIESRVIGRLSEGSGLIEQAIAALIWALAVMIAAMAGLLGLAAITGWMFGAAAGGLVALGNIAAALGAIKLTSAQLSDPIVELFLKSGEAMVVALFGGPLAWKIKSLSRMSRSEAQRRMREIASQAKRSREAMLARAGAALGSIGSGLIGKVESVKAKAIEHARERGDLARWEASQLEEQSARGKTSKAKSKRL